MTLIRGFLLVISALVVGAFFTVWTVQRTRQIGLLKALGAPTAYVRARRARPARRWCCSLPSPIGTMRRPGARRDGRRRTCRSAFAAGSVAGVGRRARVVAAGRQPRGLRRLTRVDPVIALAVRPRRPPSRSSTRSRTHMRPPSSTASRVTVPDGDDTLTILDGADLAGRSGRARRRHRAPRDRASPPWWRLPGCCAGPTRRGVVGGQATPPATRRAGPGRGCAATHRRRLPGRPAVPVVDRRPAARARRPHPPATSTAPPAAARRTMLLDLSGWRTGPDRLPGAPVGRRAPARRHRPGADGPTRRCCWSTSPRRALDPAGAAARSWSCSRPRPTAVDSPPSS